MIAFVKSNMGSKKPLRRGAICLLQLLFDFPLAFLPEKLMPQPLPSLATDDAPLGATALAKLGSVLVCTTHLAPSQSQVTEFPCKITQATVRPSRKTIS